MLLRLSRRRLGIAVALSLALAPAWVTAQSRPGDGPPVVELYRDVVGVEVEHRSWRALSLELTDEEQALQRAGAGGNRPTYAIVPGWFEDGVIEVDVAAELNGRGGAESRGFAGVAFRLGDDDRFEAVYLRAANGTLNVPPPPSPRDVRAIQYISHPDFHFSDSRAVAPGVYEKGAPIATGSWHRLRLEVSGRRLLASVDGRVVLEVDDLRLNRSGRIALWVGDGTRAYFANLRVMPTTRVGGLLGGASVVKSGEGNRLWPGVSAVPFRMLQASDDTLYCQASRRRAPLSVETGRGWETAVGPLWNSVNCTGSLPGPVDRSPPHSIGNTSS